LGLSTAGPLCPAICWADPPSVAGFGGTAWPEAELDGCAGAAAGAPAGAGAADAGAPAGAGGGALMKARSSWQILAGPVWAAAGAVGAGAAAAGAAGAGAAAAGAAGAGASGGAAAGAVVPGGVAVWPGAGAGAAVCPMAACDAIAVSNPATRIAFIAQAPFCLLDQ